MTDNTQHDQNTIEDVINRAIEEKTFSLDAVEAIKSMRDELKATNAINEALKEDIATATDARKSAENKAQALTETVSEMKSREKAIVTRELACHKAEISNAANLAASGVWREAMQIVFKPVTLRKSIMNNGPYSDYNSGTGQTTMVPGTNMGGEEVTTEE